MSGPPMEPPMEPPVRELFGTLDVYKVIDGELVIDMNLPDTASVEQLLKISVALQHVSVRLLKHANTTVGKMYN